MKPDRSGHHPRAGASGAGSPRTHTPDLVRTSLANARTARKIWEGIPVAERCRRLRLLADYLTDHADEIAATIAASVGKTRIDALATEVIPIVAAVRFHTKLARRALKPSRLPTGSSLFLNKRAFLYREPLGTVGIITPWNYPFAIPMHQIIPALLAGNSVIFKTSPASLEVGEKIDKILNAAALPAGLFTYVNLDGPVLGDILLSDGGVDKLFFTGSVPVGRELMSRAAQRLVPVSLELGGNDAMIVASDANLERAVNGAVWAGLQNAGQSCAGIERIYVEAPVHERFLSLLRSRVQNLRIGPDRSFDVDIGAITTVDQLARIEHHVNDALDRGARIVARSDPAPGTTGNFSPVIVLDGMNHDMIMMREETFGPVLGVMRVKSLEEAVKYANDSSYGLTASVWTSDRKGALRMARRIRAGTITINDHLLTHGMPGVPWGGIDLSGYGWSHGRMGLEEMTRPKVVVDDHLAFTRRNYFWHPYSAELYGRLKGILVALYGRGIRKRVKALGHAIAGLPRIFRS